MDTLTTIIGQAGVIALGILIAGFVLFIPEMRNHPACRPDEK